MAEDRALAWDEEIQSDSSFTILPAGEYQFTVKAFERGNFPGSEKMKPCNKAMMHLEVTDGTLSAEIVADLILNAKMEWKIAEFFRSVGMKKHGEKVKMDFNGSIGKSGKCKVGIRKYTKKDGTQGESNQIDSFLDYVPAKPVAPAVTAVADAEEMPF